MLGTKRVRVLRCRSKQNIFLHPPDRCNQGVVPAQFNLGAMFRRGVGVPKDEKEADR